MKKLSLIIILLSLLFANINYSYSSSNQEYSEWYIEKLLDLRVWIEEYDLTLWWIEQMYFSDSNTQALFNEYKNTILLLNKEIISKYINNEFSYSQINWIISNQKMFVYHINKLFYNISLKDYYPNDKSLDDAILEHYSKARTYYKRLQYLVNK